MACTVAYYQEGNGIYSDGLASRLNNITNIMILGKFIKVDVLSGSYKIKCSLISKFILESQNGTVF